jgi:hypothetical protein
MRHLGSRKPSFPLTALVAQTCSLSVSVQIVASLDDFLQERVLSRFGFLSTFVIHKDSYG